MTDTQFDISFFGGLIALLLGLFTAMALGMWLIFFLVALGAYCAYSCLNAIIDEHKDLLEEYEKLREEMRNDEFNE